VTVAVFEELAIVGQDADFVVGTQLPHVFEGLGLLRSLVEKIIYNQN